MERKRMVSSLVEYYTNGNKSQFAKMLGITPQTINTWISRNTFNAELIYAKCEGVSANWLLTGCGSMINEQEREVNASLQVQEKFPLKTDNLVDLQRIPLYNLEATAGLVSLFNDVDAIPISYISLPDLPACDGAVYVRGDSMYPLLKSGDIVLYKQVHPSRSVSSPIPSRRSRIACSTFCLSTIKKQPPIIMISRIVEIVCFLSMYL